ncbi:MAG: diacylglycerol/lipid kinase family protein [Intestinibaculum porci]|uniref:diacylglycerol/lipid kinase family protein n=1 Tax=Intestinibaculum porci TaxID=2487118 RepID=UPI000EDC7614|nr:hypothetical protein [Erysipelotrichaceae bacterium]
MKHVFLIKPVKDTYDTHPFVPVIKEIMKDYDYEIHFSAYKDHVREIIAQYPEKTRFYSVGGDGFLNQIIQALVSTKHEIVVLPFGTGNDFVRLIHHHQNAATILKESLHHQPTPIDTILVNDAQYYVNVGCFGIDACIANTVHLHNDIKVPKKSAYLYSLLKNIRSYPFYDVKIETEGELFYHGPVTLCACCNGRYYGGGFEISPKSYLNDGYMDLIILPKIRKITAPLYFSQIVTKRLTDNEKTFHKKVKECTVYTPAAMNLDGEEIVASSYHLRLIEKSLNLIL